MSLTHEQVETLLKAQSWRTADSVGNMFEASFIWGAAKSFLAVMAQDVMYSEADNGNDVSLDWSDYGHETVHNVCAFVTEFVRRHGKYIGEASGELFGSDMYLTSAGHGAGFFDRPEHYGDADALSDACDMVTGFHVEAYLSDARDVAANLRIGRKTFAPRPVTAC